MNCSLRGAIGNVVKSRRDNTIDRADVYNPRGVFWSTRRLKQWQQLLDEEKNTLHIGIHDLIPTDLRKFLERCTPANTRVINQYIEFVFLLRQRFDQGTDAIEFGNIARHRNALSTKRLHQPFGGGITSLHFARTDIDLGTTCQKSPSNHRSDSA